MTMTLITTVNPDSVTTVTVSSIPSSFTDLLILASLRDDGSGTNHYLSLKFNGGATSYVSKNLWGNGGSADWSSSANEYLEQFVTGAGATANTFSNIQIYVPNYALSNQKSFNYDGVSETNSASAWQTIGAGLWENTSAITSFTLGNNSGSFVSGSVVSVYGITKGSGGATVA